MRIDQIRLLQRGPGRGRWGYALALCLALICLPGFVSRSGGMLTAGDTVIEQFLPELQQIRNQQRMLEYERLLNNNNLVVIGEVEPADRQNMYTVKVKEVLKTGQNAPKVSEGDELTMQCWNIQIKKGGTFILPMYLWGQGNNPANMQAMPIEIGKEFKTDPRYKLYRFILDDDGDPSPVAYTQAIAALYKAIPAGDLNTDGRLNILGFTRDKHLDRVDGKNAEFMAALKKVIHEELLGNADKLAELSKASVDTQVNFERELAIVVALYALCDGLNAADEAEKLLTATPLALRAIDPLFEKFDDAGRTAFEAQFLPVLQAQIDAKKNDRNEVQALYLARILKSEKCIDAIKTALEADAARADAILLARTLVMLRGADAWPTVEKVFNAFSNAQDGYPQVLIKVELLKETVEHVGQRSYSTVVKVMKSSLNMQNMVYQIFNGMSATSRDEFGYVMLDAGLHGVLPILLQNHAQGNTRLMEFTIRYAVGEVHLNETTDPNLAMNEQNQLTNACMQARSWLKQVLGVDVNTRSAFNDWYLGKLDEVKIPVPDELTAKLARWKTDLASPKGEERDQAQKEIRDMGDAAMPALLDLVHTAPDLSTRKTARAMLLQLPLASQVFSAN